MSEIRQMVVSLTTDTSSASQNLRGLRAAVAGANAAFAEASAGVKGFENTTAGMRAKVQQLTDTLAAQQKMAATYGQEIDKASKRLQEAKGRQEGLAQAVKAAEAAYKESVQMKGKDAEETQALAKELDRAKAAVVANEKAMTSAARAIQSNETQQARANARVKETSAALEEATKRLNRYGGAWKDVMRKASVGAEVVADKANQAGKWAMTRITMPIAGLATVATKAAIDWDTAWVGVKKTVDGTEEQMASLRRELMDLGGELPSTLSDIAGVAESAGQLGIQRGNIAGFTRTMINLGNATNLTATEAAQAAAQFGNIYQMDQALMGHWGSTVVALGNNFATTEKDIVAMSMGLAAAGKQAKLSEADTLALATALSSLGLEAAGGSSAMSKVMMDMGIAVAKGGKALDNFAKVAGMGAADFAQAWQTEPAKAIDAFIQGLGRIERSGGNVALTLQEMGYNERRLLDALQRLTGAGDLFTRALQTGNQGWRENNALTAEAAQRNNSLAGVLQRTKNRITVAAVEIGEKLTPYIRQAADWVAGLVEGFRNLDPAVQANILKWAGIAAAVGPAVLMIGKLAGAISTVTKLLAGPAGWAILGVSAVAALGIKLATTKTAAEKAKEALGNIRMSVSADSQAQITEGINKGIAAAKSKHEITVTIDADTKEMSDQIDAIFSDGKMDKAEYKAASDFVKEKIIPDIEAAKTLLGLEVEAYRKSLTEARVDIGAQTRAVQEQLEALFADNYLTPEEFTAASTFVNDMVVPDINAAKETLDEKVAEYRSSLEGATNAEGQLLSDAEKEALVAEFEQKHKTQIAELEAALGDYNALLKAIKDNGGQATAEQITNLNAAIEKVDELRKAIGPRLLTEEEQAGLLTEYEQKHAANIKELETAVTEYQTLLETIRSQGGKATEEQVAALEAAVAKVGELRKAIYETYDAAVSIGRADYNLTVAGGGNAQSMGSALGFVSQTRANEIAVAQDALDKAKAAATTNEETAAAYEVYSAAVQAANQKAQVMYERIAEGVAQSGDGVQETIALVGTLQDALNTLGSIDLKADDYDLATQFQSLFGEDGVLAKYATDDIRNLIDYRLKGSSEDVNLAAELARKVIGETQMALAKEVEDATKDASIDPVADLLKGMLDVGAYDALDYSTVQGPLLDALKLVDLTSGGELLGKQVPEGVKLGINAGAATSLSAEQLSPMRTAVTEAIRSLFQIRSPSHLVEPLGREIPAGLALGITGNKNAMVAAIQELYAAAMREVTRLEPLLQRAMSSLHGGVSFGGGGGKPGNTTNDYSSTANVNIQNYVAHSATDVNVMSQQIAALNRRRIVAVGGRPGG